MKPLLFVLILVLAILGLKFLFPELLTFTNLDTIKSYHDGWLLFYQDHPFELIALFILFNIFMAMLPVPGISMISFIGGALFGFVPGVIYSSVATAIGNLGGFFLGRYFLKDWVMTKYGHRVKVFNEDWQKKGAMALFSFRLFPLIPSFVANLVMGVSPLHWWTFFWVSWLGRIPMVLVYTYAGQEVAILESVNDIVKPSIIVSFTMLALLPWIFNFYKTRENKK